MPHAALKFHGRLNDFLRPNRRDSEIIHEFEDGPSIKDMIESQGVPHTEVKLILVNGKAVNFAYRVQPTDQISVYPSMMGTGMMPVSGVESPAADEISFVLDVHLGRLAAYLRMLGFDTIYFNKDSGDEALARISSTEDRVLLTRDVGLLKRGNVRHGHFMRNTQPAKQLAEVLHEYGLMEMDRPFRRCLKCNALLQVIDKDALGDRLTDRTRQYYDEFRICPDCDQVFWKGSHYLKMRQLIDQVLAGEITP